MNKYVKEFLHRGLIFGGFGPIITAVIIFIVSLVEKNVCISGYEMFIGVLSTYILAFVHAGSSVFNQVEHWSIMKSLLCHLGTLYVMYIVTYIINSWIPFDLSVILIFTAIFVATYLIIWGIVYTVAKNTGKKLSKKLT